ncbi:hypothetical protein Taro_011418 [Colocasia esculenta]|uniref:Uncharacterized protein n=1 Tax=Colocasia esculenta TaxID=4460 RepID=A0A843U9V4_COLES|nr:hypothetical protein [Colocasia esculenta]
MDGMEEEGSPSDEGHDASGRRLLKATRWLTRSGCERDRHVVAFSPLTIAYSFVILLSGQLGQVSTPDNMKEDIRGLWTESSRSLERGGGGHAHEKTPTGWCFILRESGRSRGNAGRSLHSAFFAKCVVSLARLRPVRGRRTRVRHVTGLTGLDEVFRHSWYQNKVVVMADRRDWGGGGDDPEESTLRMIEWIWESLTDIRMRMDQQAPVPLVVGEAVPVAPVPPQPGVEITFVAPVHGMEGMHLGM